MKTRVLVCDDSVLLRQVLVDMLQETGEVEVVGVACDGEEGVRMVRELRPDVVTMDVEMPKLTGLEALGRIMRESPVPVVMVSTLTSAGTAATLEALEKGAVDFICKPKNGSFIALRSVRDELLAKIRAAKTSRFGAPRPRAAVAPAAVSVIPSGVRQTDKVVVIASSTGGPKALVTLFEHLPRGFGAPTLIVQHMPSGFTESFAKRLDQIGTVPCREAKHGDRVTPGLALMAPGGKHLRVRPGGEVELFDSPPLHGVRPAADYLFESAAKVYGRRCVGAVLTGMGKDGAAGAAVLRQSGAWVVGESESTCTVYGMPRAAMAAGGIDRELPIDAIGKAIAEAVYGRLANAS